MVELCGRTSILKLGEVLEYHSEPILTGPGGAEVEDESQVISLASTRVLAAMGLDRAKRGKGPGSLGQRIP